MATTECWTFWLSRGAPLMGVPLAILFLLGCSGEVDKEPTIHFLMWKPHQPAPLEEVIADFEMRTGIRVERHIASENASQYYLELTTKLRHHDPQLDVFFLDVIWPTEFAARDYLVDLSSRVGAGFLEDFFPGPRDACRVNEKLVAVPFTIDVGLLYYRKDLLAKYGFSAPRRWDEMVVQIDRILAGEGGENPDLVGYSGQFRRYEGLVCNLLEFVGSRGGSFFNNEGRPTLDEPEVIDALRWVRDEILHSQGSPRRASPNLLNAREQESRALFARGDAIFLRNWPETWRILNDPDRSEVVGKVGMAPLPAFEGGSSVSTLGGWQLGISAHSTKREWAWELVKYLTSRPVQKRLAIGLAQTMARVSIYEDEELLNALPHFGREGEWGAPLLEACRAARPRPRLVRYHAVSDRLQQVFHEALRDPDSDIVGLMEEGVELVQNEIFAPGP